ncbi:MAG: hypothetical protein V3W34_00400 [Phycisphaerae bacterium]
MSKAINNRTYPGRVGTVGRAGWLAVTLATPLLLSACRHEPGDANYRALPGTFEEINLTNNVVKFRYLHSRSGEYRERHGFVPRDAEILINGRLSRLADVKLGEELFAIWRIESFGDREKISAIKINIVRDDDRSADDPPEQPE